MSVAASLVKELRDLTGAGMMECKRALEETGGDLEAARRLLRERGQASAGRLSGKETREGKVLARTEDSHGAIVAVGCETEPVANNEEFLSYAQQLLDAVEVEGPQAAANLEDGRVELVARLGENVDVRGAARFRARDGEVVVAYVHPPAQKIGVLVRMNGTPELARRVAMHISFANPRYLRREEIPEAEIASEREIYEKLPEIASKPEHIRPRIVEGKLAKEFYAANVLADQPWVHDPSLTVGRALADEGADVREFVRYALVPGR